MKRRHTSSGSPQAFFDELVGKELRVQPNARSPYGATKLKTRQFVAQ